MRLSDRIYKLASKVQPGESAADIGTDHGYVPMILMRDNISPYVIMSDISEGSLSKAFDTFKAAGIECDPACFRVGDGLETIAAGETDTVIIAGLGGHTIADILDADRDKSRSFMRLILQPRKHSGTLRHYLYTNGWDITDEDLALEGKFSCEIICAEPGEQQYREEPYPEDDIRWKYPRELVTADSRLAAMRIEWKISSIEEQIDSLSRAASDHQELIVRLNNDREYLKQLLIVQDNTYSAT